ncbi:MAG: hypothetical protein IJP54_00885 [Synergistaceae bacterium]|nr:hypothetical protein [Synergistaceae bacterium]
MTIDRTDSGMQLFVQYSSELFDDALISGFMEQIRETLRLMHEKPDAKISDVSAAYSGSELFEAVILGAHSIRMFRTLILPAPDFWRSIPDTLTLAVFPDSAPRPA